MKEMFSTLVTILLYVFTLTSEGKGLYCIGKKQHWLDAMAQCQDQGGTPLPYMVGLDNVLRQTTAVNTSIWTVDFLIDGGHQPEQLCEFRYMSTPTDFGQSFYGDCNKNRSYICWNSKTSKWRIFTGNHNDAIKTCGEISAITLSSIFDIFKPGYYWMIQSRHFQKVTLYGQNSGWTIPAFEPFRCGAFSKDAGSYFRMCTDSISPLCHYVNEPVKDDVYETCFRDSSTATKRSTRTTSFILSNIRVTSQPFDQNLTKIPRANSAEKLKEEGKDLGATVGLSVGLSLALICGIIFAIYMSRRYRCWKTISSNNYKSKANRQCQMSSTGRVITHANPSYEVNPNKIQTVEYSLVNKKDNKVRYAGEQTHVTEQKYDVSGNVQSHSSNTSYNVYNTLQNEAYDSTNNVCREVFSDNVYDGTQGQDTCSVYDSTRQTIDLTQYENVYNHLSVGTGREDQTYDKLR